MEMYFANILAGMHTFALSRMQPFSDKRSSIVAVRAKIEATVIGSAFAAIVVLQS